MRSVDTDAVPAPILIVGAGPVGLTLAVDLARRGVAVRIIDALPKPTDESRAIVVHARSLDQLAPLGVTDRLMESGTKSTGVQFHAEDRVVAHVPLDTVDSLHPYSWTTPQTETERVLSERLGDLGVAVERGKRLTDLRQGDGRMVATVEDGSENPKTIEAPWVVGTDGAHSKVRGAIGERLHGAFEGETFVLADVEADYAYEKSAFHVFFAPGRATALLFPMMGRRARVFAELPDGVEAEREPSLEWLRGALAARSMKLDIERAHWLTRFQIHHAQVSRYRVGRAFLAGDAAHVHSPAGGQGMNTGIQDALNLGWKLALAWRGRASELLLDSYHLERQPVAAHVIQFSTALTSVATLSSPLLCRLRNSAMKGALSRPRAQHALADEIEEQHVRCPESSLVSGATSKLHAGTFLLDEPALGVTSALEAPATAQASAHVALCVADEDGSLPGVSLPPSVEVIEVREPGLRSRLGFEHSSGVVLVRPDGYVGLVARSTQPEAVDVYFARLTEG